MDTLSAVVTYVLSLGPPVMMPVIIAIQNMPQMISNVVKMCP